MAESATSLGERIARLEALQKTAAERAAEDRAEMKAAINDVRDDIAQVKTSVGEITKTVQSAVDQITGGRKVLHALWITGTLAGGLLAWASGLLKTVAGYIAR